MMVDHDSRVKLKSAPCPLELILTWLENLMVVGQDTGVINVAPPILSRAFQTLANGMIAFHDAAKVAETPYPLPYAQTCDLLLLLHWCIAPFTFAQFSTRPTWALVFCFAQVFVFWSLNLTAQEIEDPFGRDANDIDLHSIQHDMNCTLTSLLHEDTLTVPSCKGSFATAIHTAFTETKSRSHRTFRDLTEIFPETMAHEQSQGHGEVLDAKGRWEAFDRTDEVPDAGDPDRIPPIRISSPRSEGGRVSTFPQNDDIVEQPYLSWWQRSQLAEHRLVDPDEIRLDARPAASSSGSGTTARAATGRTRGNDKPDCEGEQAVQCR